METRPSNIHILMRYSDKLHSVKDVIEEHKRVIKNSKAVWIAKLGKPLGRPHIDRLAKQVAEGIPTYLFLVQRIDSGYVLYRGAIEAVSRSLPKKEADLVPHYYNERGIIRDAGVWFKLSSIRALDNEELNNLLISSSLMSVRRTLQASMAAIFIVREGKGIGA